MLSRHKIIIATKFYDKITKCYSDNALAANHNRTIRSKLCQSYEWNHSNVPFRRVITRAFLEENISIAVHSKGNWGRIEISIEKWLLWSILTSDPAFANSATFKDVIPDPIKTGKLTLFFTASSSAASAATPVCVPVKMSPSWVG